MSVSLQALLGNSSCGMLIRPLVLQVSTTGIPIGFQVHIIDILHYFSLLCYAQIPSFISIMLPLRVPNMLSLCSKFFKNKLQFTNNVTFTYY